jgi:DUF1680 family protein
MEVQKIAASEKVKDDIGKVALQRGPLVYCAEWPDNGGKVANLIVPTTASFTAEYKPSLLNGVVVIRSEVPAIEIGEGGQSIQTVKKPMTAIPYYAWAHRGRGEMTVWFPQQVKDIDIVTYENKEAAKPK